MVGLDSIGRIAGKSASDLAKKGGSIAATAYREKGAIGMAGAAIGLSGVYSETKASLDNGNSLSTSLFKSGVSYALWQTNPGLMMATTFAPMAIDGMKSAHQFRRARGEEIYRDSRGPSGMVGTGFQDTQQAYTMRQAAVQQIQGNKLNARSALGGEARIFSNQYRR